MQIDIQKHDDASVLHIDGRLDANSAPDLEKRLSEVIEQGEKAVVLDFARVAYVSSAGLRILLMGAKKLNGTGRNFLLCGLNASVMEVLKITGFQRVLTIHEDLKQALAALT